MLVISFRNKVDFNDSCIIAVLNKMLSYHIEAVHGVTRNLGALDKYPNRALPPLPLPSFLSAPSLPCHFSLPLPFTLYPYTSLHFLMLFPSYFHHIIW